MRAYIRNRAFLPCYILIFFCFLPVGCGSGGASDGGNDDLSNRLSRDAEVSSELEEDGEFEPSSEELSEEEALDLLVQALGEEDAHQVIASNAENGSNTYTLSNYSEQQFELASGNGEVVLATSPVDPEEIDEPVQEGELGLRSPYHEALPEPEDSADAEGVEEVIDDDGALADSSADGEFYPEEQYEENFEELPLLEQYLYFEGQSEALQFLGSNALQRCGSNCCRKRVYKCRWYWVWKRFYRVVTCRRGRRYYRCRRYFRQRVKQKICRWCWVTVPCPPPAPAPAPTPVPAPPPSCPPGGCGVPPPVTTPPPTYTPPYTPPTNTGGCRNGKCGGGGGIKWPWDRR